MQAIVYTEYGSTEVLKLKELEKPVPGDNEVLVKVHAASVNSWDCDLVTGKPRIYRLLSGLLRPKFNIIGSDIAGTVEAVGSNVEKYKPGDEVFGDISGNGFGAFAEYVTVPEKMLAFKSPKMTFVHSAALPQAGVLALQGVRDAGKVKPGHKVLINGAGGGVGTIAIQLAKFYGAEVTGVDSTGKLELMQSVGADHVIDYTKENFTENGIGYDLILDVIAKQSLFKYRRSLNPAGVFSVIGGSVSTILSTAILGSLLSKTGSKKMGLLIHRPNKDLNYLNELIVAGNLRLVIDRTFTLREVPEAVQYLTDGKVFGKIVIRMV